ncbi:hypothetical protein Q0812_04380 [Brevundimonas sp. 2R-24]|uniref:Protein ImuA n=1 Tax=Peiella sedimenti TaxID=3061083 RepID=A0ABT8SL07_9CAUL|nr:hypothetical protein [Caulobacteraceae bacterium XZ-24]
MPAPATLQRLRDQLAALAPRGCVDVEDGFRLGMAPADLGVGPLARKGLHEVFAASSAQAVSANGFGLSLALRAAPPPLVWVLEDRALSEVGAPYGAGLHEWGLEPSDLVLVRVRSAQALLAAGEEALKSGAVGAVLMSGWGEGRAWSLTAGRRLALAAEAGAATALLIRSGAKPRPSAADTRWSVEAAPSAALEARAPGRPAFRAVLLRSRKGPAGGEWIMEWDREARSFVEPAAASGRVVPVSGDRQAGVRAA